MEVTWDPAKNAANRKKHGITFEEASELFTSGVDYLELFDAAHSETEDRFIAIGPIVEEDVPEAVVDLLEGDVVVGERVAQEDLGREEAKRSCGRDPPDLAVPRVVGSERLMGYGRGDGVQSDAGVSSSSAS